MINPAADKPPGHGTRAAALTAGHSPDALLALSAERDAWHRLAWQMWRDGYQAGHDAGYEAGWSAAEADMAAAWRAVAGPVSHGRSLAAEGWERRLAAAGAHGRRAAWAHWHDFRRRAGQEAVS